jgi:single-strand DNA-binding protein
MNLNKATIVGRVVRDPELRALPSGSQVASLSVATSRVYKKDNAKKEETEFHNVIAFGKTAEIIGQYVKKGQLILIEGRLQTRSWEKDGHKNYRTEIICDVMQMGPKPAGSTTEKKESSGAPEYPEEEINPDDIPF